MKRQYFDSHLHTSCSHDGNDSLDKICTWAVEHGVSGLAVTDHYDVDQEEEYHFYDRQVKSLAMIDEGKEKWNGKIRISKGIELSQGHRVPKEYDRVMKLANDSYDFILGSLHVVEPYGDLYYVDFSEEENRPEKVLQAYYEQNLEMVKWGKFDAFGHLGYGERYICKKFNLPYNYEPYMDVIDEIFKRLIKKGIALEVNTSGYRQGLGHPIPDRRLLERYRDLGGELLTLGSDAHWDKHVANGFDEAMDLLKDIGFRYVAFYTKRQPELISIE